MRDLWYRTKRKEEKKERQEREKIEREFHERERKKKSDIQDQQAEATDAILAGLLVAISDIPKRIEDNSEKSLLNVSALTDKHKERVDSQTTDDSNTMSRKQTWQETEESQLVSHKDGSGDGSDKTTMLKAVDTGSEIPLLE